MNGESLLMSGSEVGITAQPLKQKPTQCQLLKKFARQMKKVGAKHKSLTACPLANPKAANPTTPLHRCRSKGHQ